MSQVWFALRSRRSILPGKPLLSSSSSRRQTFAAALAQFEEQMTAAKVVSPATQPLNLYYGLAQAGMAIGAARSSADQWSFSRHGLRLGDLSQDLADIRVGPDGDGAFQRMVSATGSAPIDSPVRLGALWDSLHELQWVDLSDSPRRVALDLLPDSSTLSASLFLPYDQLQPGPDLHSRIYDILAAYPGAEGAAIPSDTEAIQPPEREPQRWIVRLEWPALQAQDPRTEAEIREFFDQIAPEDRYRDDRFLRPCVEGGNRPPPSPLMTWWLLLYSFSMLARYQPRKWTALLDLDKSRCAVSLQYALDTALSAIPHLVLEALDGRSFLLSRPVTF